MFITPAFAQATDGGGGGSFIAEFGIPFLMVGLILWFLVIRPQRVASKKRTAMLTNIRRHDTIVTNGGLIGKITKVVDDHEVEVQIAPDIKVKVLAGDDCRCPNQRGTGERRKEVLNEFSTSR